VIDTSTQPPWIKAATLVVAGFLVGLGLTGCSGSSEQVEPQTGTDAVAKAFCGVYTDLPNGGSTMSRLREWGYELSLVEPPHEMTDRERKGLRLRAKWLADPKSFSDGPPNVEDRNAVDDYDDFATALCGPSAVTLTAEVKATS
jgi:hypothetical protein